METLKVNFGGKEYLLFNLTSEKCIQLKNDSQKLEEYFRSCFETGRDICTNGDDGPSSQSHIENVALIQTTSLSHQGTKFFFLCGEKNFVYGIKLLEYPWHYFDEIDSLKSEHSSLPAEMLDSISKMTGVKTVAVNLNEMQSGNYFQNGEFIFKNKPLNTHLVIAGKRLGGDVSEKKTVRQRKTNQLVFAPGETNPLMFLKDFENCKGIKTDKDKMYNILDFVDDKYKGKFAELYFTGDWPSMKSSFLKLYTLPFVQNKKDELNISFDESELLRSFLERKLSVLAKYTTLPFVNEVEMALNDLPVEVASLFITEEKMICSEAEILAFCDKIQNFVLHIKPREELPTEGDRDLNKKSWMETCESNDEDVEICPAKSKRGRGRGRGGLRGRGALRGKVGRCARGGIRKNAKHDTLSPHATIFAGKNLKTISEDEEDDALSTDYNFLEDVSDSSQSTWSEMN